MTLKDKTVVAAAVRHLKRSDPRMKAVIEAVGPFGLTLQKDRFQMLVRSIVWQQISGKAAQSIYNRLLAKLAGGRVSAETLAALRLEELREAGISPQKASYIQDLVSKVREGEVRLDRTGRMSDAAVIAEVTRIKGVGEWTAHMYLMFSLGRPDVFPHGDLGIRSAIRRLHGLDDLPDKALSHELATPWRPYATVASWYLWRSLDLPAS